MDPKDELTKTGRSARSVKKYPQTVWSNKGCLHSDVPASRPGFDIRQNIKIFFLSSPLPGHCEAHSSLYKQTDIQGYSLGVKVAFIVKLTTSI